jgi:hypothetical protein
VTDIIDQAQAFDEQNLRQALEVHGAIAANTPRLRARGYCYNPLCEDEFDPADSGRLFCGPKCAEQHQRYTTNR